MRTSSPGPASNEVSPSSKEASSKRNTVTGGEAITGGCDRLGTAICTDGGISSVRAEITAPDTQQTIARGERCAAASKSGYDAGGASARRKTPRESSTTRASSRQAYRSG